jgi:molybdate transport system substrate-binding protein
MTHLLLTILILLILVGCTTAAPPPRALTVFAAASLTEAFTEIMMEFEANHPEIKVVELNFAGSQTLRLQIENGAKADLFASASPLEVTELLAAKLVEPPALFAHNRLVVILPAENPASVETLTDLARPGLKLVLAGPTVPAGRYAREALAKLDGDPALGANFSAQVLQNLVSEEDTVKGVVAKVRLNEADAGIVYVSDVTGEGLRTLTIPPEFNVVADYPLVVVAGGPAPDLAREFIEMVLSPRGQGILAAHGFEPVSNE